MNENQRVRSINKGSAEVEPQHDETTPSLNEAGEELVRALESALIEQAVIGQLILNSLLDNYF